MAKPLSHSQIEKARTLLTQRQAELKHLEAQGENWRATVELDQSSVGRLSRMDALQQQAMAEAEARRRTSDLVRIEAALNRMEQDEYGWCAQCGEPIAYKRLEIDPAAHLCVECAA